MCQEIRRDSTDTSVRRFLLDSLGFLLYPDGRPLEHTLPTLDTELQFVTKNTGRIPCKDC